MSKHEGLPVKGYQPQSEDAVALVNDHKAMEEHILRHLDALWNAQASAREEMFDTRWLAIARTHFEEGFMALNRAVFRPQRVSLPEDEA